MIFIDNYTPVLYLCKPKIFDHIILYSIFKESTRMSLVKCKSQRMVFMDLLLPLYFSMFAKEELLIQKL